MLSYRNAGDPRKSIAQQSGIEVFTRNDIRKKVYTSMIAILTEISAMVSSPAAAVAPFVAATPAGAFSDPTK